jgi:hypothetical protein
MAITEKHLFGWAKEVELQPILESYLGCECYKTKERYDTIDFTATDGSIVELKGRPKNRNYDPRTPQDYDSFSSWYFPCCKIGEKPLHVFYYWERSNKLFYLKYDSSKFQEYSVVVPPNHPTGQLHYLIPREDFDEIEWEVLEE